MKVIIFIVLLSIFGCQVPTSTQYSNYIEAVWDSNTIYAITSAGNLYFDAQWRGEIISLVTSAGVLEFAAPLSSASHDVTTSVQITEIDGHWYIWGAGKPQNEIYRITH